MEEKFDAVFRVYGDNIIECDQFINWLRKEEISRLRLETEVGPIDRPIFIFQDSVSNIKIAFQLCPFFGGPGPSILWPNDPLEDFDEKVDVIVTRVREDGNETKPIFAIEYVDAIQAGNQGWQRFRRAINAAKAGICYLYVLPIIGWERDSAGLTLKSPRFLQAQACIAQLVLCSKFGVPSLQIYLRSAWSDYASELGYTLPENYATYAGTHNATKIAAELIRISLGLETEVVLGNAFKGVIKEMITVARTYSNFSNTQLPIFHNHPTFNSQNLEVVSETFADALTSRTPVSGQFALHEINYDHFREFGCLFYKDAQTKTTSANFRDKVLSYLNWKTSRNRAYKVRYLRAWGMDVDESYSDAELDRLAVQNRERLPLTYKMRKSEACLIPNRRTLRTIIKDAYPELSSNVLNWIFPNTANDLPPIVLVPVYAYKPSGDSRPDRGLLPMLWAMFPSLVKKEQTMAIVYSKYTPSNWKSIVREGSNKLWSSITEIAGAVIVDKTGDGLLIH